MIHSVSSGTVAVDWLLVYKLTLVIGAVIVFKMKGPQRRDVSLHCPVPAQPAYSQNEKIAPSLREVP